MVRKKKLTREEIIDIRVKADADDPLTIIYIPWEETPGGNLTPKPEGYDAYYQNHGMSFYETKDL